MPCRHEEAGWQTAEGKSCEKQADTCLPRRHDTQEVSTEEGRLEAGGREEGGWHGMAQKTCEGSQEGTEEEGDRMWGQACEAGGRACERSLIHAKHSLLSKYVKEKAAYMKERRESLGLLVKEG